MAAPEQLPPPDAPAEEIRRTAEEVLARPEFQQPPETLLERIRGAIDDALQRALDALFASGRSGLLAWLAVAVVVGLVAVVLFRVVAGVRRDPAARDRAAVDADARRPAVDWEREAQEHAVAGRWRDALRCRYRALVARLAVLGAVEEIPGRTAGEYRLEVRRNRPAAAEPFGDATDLFERAWYGGARTGPEDDERFRDAAARVLVEADR